jgi:aryl-alcohol dehydrogenase-like predicted oxidoreductase
MYVLVPSCLGGETRCFRQEFVMRYRPLGRTGLRVSEIAFGAWGIGKSMWIGADDRESLRALRRAVDLGVNFIDTAWAYGEGYSESVIGRFLKTIPRSRRPFVATKIPPANFVWPAARGFRALDVFHPRWIRACTEESLRRLGTDCIDIQQLHVFAPAWAKEEEWRDTLEALRREGKIRFYGVSLTEHKPDTGLELVRRRLVHTIQVIYNIFDQGPERQLLPLARRHGVGILARVPLDEGGLAGTLTPRTKFPPGDFRGRYFQGRRLAETCRRADALKPVLLDGRNRTLAEGALRFCLSHDAVSTTLVGMRSVKHIEANSRVSDGRRLTPAQRRALKRHAWRRDFYTNW